MAATTDLLTKVGLPGSATTLDSPGFTIGNTTINVGNTANWQTETLQCFAMDQVTIEAGKEVRVAGSYRELEGIVTSATSIGSVSFSSGFSPRNYPAGSTTRVYIPVSSTRENKLVDWGKAEHNLNGTHKNITATSIISAGSVTASSFIVSGAQTTAGWLPLGVSQSGTIVHNGNRSYDVPFASSVAAILTPGMRLLLEKTVPGNAYMGGIFNATNQYFTKVSPTGALATITNNFTLMAHIMPTAYVDGIICGRSDAASNNALELRMLSNGTLAVLCFNGGVGNYTAVFTYQSVSLNKKSHVAVTWASGAVALYIDGISVPVTAPTTSGTAPTTAGTGGDWSVGRKGAYAGSYFAGYISNVAVFNAALTASLIRQYSTYKSSWSEPSCIGAWSLDNTAVNQAAPGTNDLTAMNDVSYTAASPHGQLSNYIDASKAIALVMAVNGSTVTVQTPEGVTIPTTGGISAVSYATSGVPFGWVTATRRWELRSQSYINLQNAAMGNTAYQNQAGRSILLNKGSWDIGGSQAVHMADANTTLDIGLSSSATTFSSPSELPSLVNDTAYRLNTATAGQTDRCAFSGVSITVETPFTIYAVTRNSSGGTRNVYWTDAENAGYIRAIPAGI